jgi:Fe-S-cluster containining protein
MLWLFDTILGEYHTVAPNLKPISLDEPFRFGCSQAVPCFNACCRDLNQFLTPYDILRLKDHLGLTAQDFLNRYCSQHIGAESGLPIVTLKPKESRQLTCPFVTPAGCKVYVARPSACRIYPVVRVVSKSRESGETSERFMVLKESHCLGFSENQEQTVRQWIEQQGIGVYNEFNDRLMEIISLKNRLMPGPLDTKSRTIFHLGLYDLDNFRSQIFEKNLPPDMNIDRTEMEKAQTDDAALLKIGIQWAIRELFRR